jgi:uncharacterized protein (TIGR02996 family)
MQQMTAARTDDLAFFRACIDAPLDELPRLLWAVRLDETGRAKHAAYLRSDTGAVLIAAAAESVRGGADLGRTATTALWFAEVVGIGLALRPRRSPMPG